MTTARFLANGGNDRLTVSTICTHLAFFHEVGFQYCTEHRLRTPFVWWKPTSWRGFKWALSDDVEQPRNVRCTFNGVCAHSKFGASSQSSLGHFKLSCDELAIRPHCVWVVHATSPRTTTDSPVRDSARNVRNILVQFEYDGQLQTVRHGKRTEIRG